MKKIILYCLIVGVASVIADPIKANIGGRNTILYGDSLSYNNPYITDGLIAMWDGEWNSGFGVHDDNSSIWKDLSFNGYDLTVNGGSFGDNYFDATGTNYASEANDLIYEATKYQDQRDTLVKENPKLFKGNSLF